VTEQTQVLVIDDEERYRRLYAETLRRAGFAVTCAASAEEATEHVRASLPAMIVTDVRMPGMDGITFLKQIKAEHADMPVLLITAYADVRDAVNALKLGAVDYLEKPVDLDELVAAVSDVLGVKESVVDATVPAGLLEGVVAESAGMRSLLADAYRVARSDATVLVTGESGTGKEVVARFMHAASARADKPFVAVNCAAIPANILASELFGHRKGAFTGAVAARGGRFREAQGGTLFLDEIGDMPLELQPSLLRAIETGKICPLGSDTEVDIDFRLIAATNRDLGEEVAEGRFREDLFYRVNVIAFEVPPLRERPDDILPLARFFLSSKGSTKRFSPAASSVIQRYRWPGNARELANAMERAAILSNTEVILPEHLPAAMRDIGDSRPPVTNEVKTMQQAELEAIRSALQRTNGNRTHAAQLLGISRRALIYKLKRFEIDA